MLSTSNKSQKNMKTKTGLSLIDGKFSPKEARELLVNLFSSKIKFHQMKNFSSQERFGKDDKLAAKKIPLLKENIEILTELIKKAETKKEKLVIKSIIEISFSTSKK